MTQMKTLFFCCAAALTAPLFANAQTAPPAAQAAPLPTGPSYASIARQVLGSPLVIDGVVRSATRVKDAEAAGLVSGRARFYVEIDVTALIRGTGAMASRVAYLVDVPLDARGRAPKLKRLRVLAFARPVPNAPDQVQLTGVDAQIPWTPEVDSRVRGIVREVLAADAPEAITGVGNAFHVPGSLPGEGETQIFLLTGSGQQISLQVLRRPNQQPRWSVSTGDFIDESAGAPRRDTLLWYRLACGLPATLPPTALEAGDPESARIAREDYQFVRDSLGPCT